MYNIYVSNYILFLRHVQVCDSDTNAAFLGEVCYDELELIQIDIRQTILDC